MSELTVFSDQDATTPTAHSYEHAEIAARLANIGIRFEQWQTDQDIIAGDREDKIMSAYQADIDHLIEAEGYQAVDIVSIAPDHPDKATMRQKFLAEHTHRDDEVRFFVDGHGLFSLHVAAEVYEVLCEKGDLISVPAKTKHWFDMGPNPRFVAIRLFNDPEGWVAQYTGSDIADRFSRLDN